MRRRPSSRLLVLDRAGRVLLFRFVHRNGPLTGRDYWATPGGGLEPNETFEAGAIRELKEETGLDVAHPGRSIAQREFVLQLPDGEQVLAEERFFVVDAAEQTVHRERWTALETEIMTEHKWWSVEELETTTETVWPSDLPALLRGAGRW